VAGHRPDHLRKLSQVPSWIKRRDNEERKRDGKEEEGGRREESCVGYWDVTRRHTASAAD